MKVLHVMAGGEHGGAETMFADTVAALAEAGVAQTVVSRPSPLRDALFREVDVPVRHARFPLWFGWSTAGTIARTIRETAPDVVHYWMARAAGYARPGRAPNIGWFGGYYDLKYYKHCDGFIGVTRDIARHIREAGAPADRTAAVHTFARLDEEPPVPRASLDTPEDAPLLLALARLHPKKGLDTLLQALTEVPDPYLWIAGEGPSRAELIALTERLGLTRRVRFLGWRTDRAALLGAADLCVFPSRYEPFGTVMVEAWMTGVPLVAAAAAGPKAYVEPDVNGLLVPIDDAPALAAAIRRCLTEPALRARLVQGGWRTYEELFTKAVLVRDLLAFYERMVAWKNNPSRLH